MLEPKNEGLSQKLEQTHGYAERPVPRVSRYLEATLFTQQYNGQAVKSAQAFAHAQRARDARLLEHAWQRAAPNTTHGIDCFASRQANSHKTCANSSGTLFAMKYLWHTVDYNGVLRPRGGRMYGVILQMSHASSRILFDGGGRPLSQRHHTALPCTTSPLRHILSSVGIRAWRTRGIRCFDLI